MVLRKITIGKGDFDNSLSSQDAEELRRQCHSAALFAVLVALALVVFAAASHSALQRPAALTAADIERLQNEYYEDAALLQNASRALVCYYDLPPPAAPRRLRPAAIQPRLCTHINAAFAQIKDNAVFLEDHQRETIGEIVVLKKTNPDLKVLLSVGGSGSHSGFRDMVFNHTCRKIFIRSLKYTLRNLSLDGVDLDWEFPAVEYQSESAKRERQHFSQLLREIRMEYRREKKDYLLTVAVAAQQVIVDAAYDVDQMDLYVDFVNIMTYDFHTYTQFTPQTGLNSPLYPRHGEELYPATLNINYTVQLYKSKGLSPNKIVVGIPTYGHSFTLVNSENTKVGSPALGFGQLGELGFVNYPDICAFLNEFQNETTINIDQDAKVPYMYRNTEWVSYDNPESVAMKAKFIRDNNLHGAMIYSLNADDFMGVCGVAGMAQFPLSASIKNTLHYV